MAAKKEATFAELLLQGAREAAAHASGDGDMVRRAKVTRRPLTARHLHLRRPDQPSAERIRKIRDNLDLSQSVFSDLLNVSKSTVRAWEQGQRAPDGPSLRLLEIADHHPDALLSLATKGGKRSAGRAPAKEKEAAVGEG
ncbi:MAG: helix-turn-helix domain-containing protein [Longimicrobiales bacterium]|nr:helix-turn-helix domain-containing protein [Longimicrobiales bacterium]